MKTGKMKRSLLHYTFPLIFALCIGFPTLQLPYTLINDGIVIEDYRKFNINIKYGNWSSIIKQICDKKNGRFIPAYHLINYASLGLFGESVKAQRFIHLVRFAIIFLCLYTLIYKITERKYIGMFSILPFAFCSLIYEKWFRIGAPEASIVALLSISFLTFYLCKHEKIVLHRLFFLVSLACLPFIYFLKEITVAIIPSIVILALLLLYFKKEAVLRRRTLIYSSSHLLICISFFSIRYLAGYSIESGSYSSHYQLSQNSALVFKNVAFYCRSFYDTYSLFVLLPFLLWGYYLVIYVLNGRMKRLADKEVDIFIWSTVAVVFFTSMIGIYLPWKNASPVYLFPAVFGFSVLFALTINLLVDSLSELRSGGILRLVGRCALVFLGIGFLVEVVLLNSINMFNLAQYHRVRDFLDRETIAYLAKITPPGGRVWTTISPPEPLYEAQKHLEIFYGRSDVIVSGLNDAENSDLNVGDIVAIRKPYRHLDDAGIWEVLESKKSMYLGSLGFIKKEEMAIIIGGVGELMRILFGSQDDSSSNKAWPLRNYRMLSQFYKVIKHVNVAELIPYIPYKYRFDKGKKPVLSKGFWEDGWVTVNNSIVLRIPRKRSRILIEGSIPQWAGYDFPYRFTIESDSGWQQEVEIDKDGQFSVMLTSIDTIGFGHERIRFSIVSPQNATPSKRILSSADTRKILFFVSFLGFE